MEPKSGQTRVQVRWQATTRYGTRPGAWVVFHGDRRQYFVKWENAIYFANYAAAASRQERETES